MSTWQRVSDVLHPVCACQPGGLIFVLSFLMEFRFSSLRSSPTDDATQQGKGMNRYMYMYSRYHTLAACTRHTDSHAECPTAVSTRTSSLLRSHRFQCVVQAVNVFVQAVGARQSGISALYRLLVYLYRLLVYYTPQSYRLLFSSEIVTSPTTGDTASVLDKTRGSVVASVVVVPVPVASQRKQRTHP